MSATTAAMRSSTAAGRLLSLLHLLRLLRVCLLQLLRLLLVSLLHLLRLHRVSLLFGQFLVVPVLLLLQVLPVLGLLRDQLILLLLVFRVRPCIPRVRGGGTPDGRQFLGMSCDVRARSRTHRRRAVVRRILLLRVIPGSPLMLSLLGDRPHVSVMSRSFFLSVGVIVDSAVAAVVADVIHCALVHPCVVSVVEVVRVHVVVRRVVEEMPVVPASALITMAEVSVAVVNPAVKTNRRAPVAFVEVVSAVAPTPIARRPKKSQLPAPSPKCPVPNNSRNRPKPSIPASKGSRRQGMPAGHSTAAEAVPSQP